MAEKGDGIEMMGEICGRGRYYVICVRDVCACDVEMMIEDTWWIRGGHRHAGDVDVNENMNGLGNEVYQGARPLGRQRTRVRRGAGMHGGGIGYRTELLIIYVMSHL